ncbi:MAG: tRNA (adenosine(37)-N6)-threonylcarbamoyltransferase complex transferase subunit TsaD [Casimicrobiaceae bacterium]|nr:tRNA (adenosine(37)-N6)-threonylcarbamoyltransferase complex transferase subunit TsaD [Casimicrobiaceae bacterium]
MLGIESSCDETGVALFDLERARIVAERLRSQTALHAPYGGVVPEIASRDHIRYALALVAETLAAGNATAKHVCAIAYTAGPGLAGALLVGAQLAASLGMAWRVPVLPVHHMEAHLLSPLLATPRPEFPFLALLVSGGHTQLLRVDGAGRYRLLGETIDDAAGEAFDKSAKLLGLPYPGGPHLAQLAAAGNPSAFALPRPLLESADLNFSFAGLKTAVSRVVRSLLGQRLPTRAATPAPAPELPANHPARADLAASIEAAIVEILATKALRALEQERLSRLVVAGGVGANHRLRERLEREASRRGAQVFFPPISLCTDNGAMVAFVGAVRLAEARCDYGVRVRPRWPIIDLEAPRLTVRANQLLAPVEAP